LQTITIEKPDKTKLNALLFYSAVCQHILIICHGFRGRKENSGKIFSFAERLNQAGYGVLAFDFSGSGESDGEFKNITLTGQASDLTCIIEYIQSKYNLPIILLGRSFGGTTVLSGAAENINIAGYILWSTPVYLHETFAEIMADTYNQLQMGNTVRLSDAAGEFEISPDFIRDFDAHNMERYLAAIGNRPVLIIHGLSDTTVHPSNASYMSRHLPNAELKLIKGAEHRFENKIREREDITLAWLKKTFPKGGNRL